MQVSKVVLQALQVTLLVLLTGCVALSPPETRQSARPAVLPTEAKSRGVPAMDAQPARLTSPAMPAGNMPAGEANPAVAGLLRQAAQARMAGDLQKAQTLAERAQGLAPREARTYLELAEIYQAKGDHARARQLALRGLQFCGADEGLRNRLQGFTQGVPAQ